MPPRRRRSLLLITLLLATVTAWDTTLGPDAGYWGVRLVRPDPPPLSPRARPAGAMRVLFIGNSFTRYWGGQVLIGTELALSSPAGRERTPIYEQSTANGYDFQDHWREGQAVARIREGNWDYVVLQEHSEGPLDDRDSFFKYARLFDADVTRVGAKTVFFMTWAKKHQPQRQAAIAAAYNDLARELGARVVPVGLAFQAALAERPSLKLYDADGKHPSEAGSYLTACCFYSFFYGKSAQGLRHQFDDRGKVWLDVSDADAEFLQDVAYRTVMHLPGLNAGPTERRD
jgi:hypothetical protein